MNMQAMMQQAQKLQRDMMKAKQEVEEKIFNAKQSLVEVEVNGKKEVLKIKFDENVSLDKDDTEMLEDMIILALNDAFKQVDNELNSKMSKYGNMAGLL